MANQEKESPLPRAPADIYTEKKNGAKLLRGLRKDGSSFIVPVLPDALDTFINPKHWNFSTLLTLVFSVITVYVSLNWSIWWSFALCIIWRLMYNVLLGQILRVQSNSEGFTKFIEVLEKNSYAKKNAGRLSWS